MKTTHTALALPLVADACRRPFPEIRILPDGRFFARDGRPGTLTGGTVTAWSLLPETASAVLALWRQRATPLVIDYEHQSLNTRHNGQPAPAAGWIDSLRYQPGEGLIAAVRWTEQAASFIARDEYRFISPVFAFHPQTGEILELKGAALTNTPALDGLGAVAASVTSDMGGLGVIAAPDLSNAAGLGNAAKSGNFGGSSTAHLQPEPIMTVLSRMKRLLELPDTATEEELAAALDALESLLATASPDKEMRGLLQVVRSTPPEAALTPLVQANAALRERLEAALTESCGDRVTQGIEAAVADGRLSRGLVGWASDLGRRDPQALETYLSAVSPVAALTSLQSGGRETPEARSSALNEEERFVCAQLGMEESAYLGARDRSVR